MFLIQRLSILLVLASFSMSSFSAEEQPAGPQEDPEVLAAPKTLQDLLQKVKADRASDRRLNQKREAEFRRERDKQSNLVKQAEARLRAEKKRGDDLKKQFDDNEVALADLSEKLRLRLGTLGELFGVVRQVANDTSGLFQTSLTAYQYPDRDQFLTDLAQSKELPTISQLEQLWFELQREMTDSGRVVSYEADVISGQGGQETKKVTRIGLFNVVADGKYLVYKSETNQYEELERQPDARYLDSISELESAQSGYTEVALDPTRGVLLSLLVQAPNERERIEQGGLVGYVILALGALGLLLGLFRLLVLFIVGLKVKSQIKNPDEPKENNPLGRIIKAYQDNKQVDLEALQYKLDEVILQNIPPLERGISSIKLIASVAPLLGLLGTVLGMITTFQAITLFGTGDPKLMANGISEALVTTMLGLIVAIPMLFLHNLVKTRSDGIIQVLQEQSEGFIADKAEQESRGRS